MATMIFIQLAPCLVPCSGKRARFTPTATPAVNTTMLLKWRLMAPWERFGGFLLVVIDGLHPEGKVGGERTH